MKSKVLITYSSEERDIAENLAQDMKEIEDKLGLDHLLISLVYFHDNARNSPNVPKLTEAPRFGIGYLVNTISLLHILKYQLGG